MRANDHTAGANDRRRVDRAKSLRITVKMGRFKLNSVESVRQVLSALGTVAIVGLSADPGRPSYRVARYLKHAGIQIVPVNPRYTEVLGERCYPRLTDVPRHIDTVDVFRRPEDCLAIAEDAVAVKARVLWLQEGITDPAAEEFAARHGLLVIANRCLKVDHANFLASQ